MIKYALVFAIFILSLPSYAGDIDLPRGIYSSHVGRDVGKYIDKPYVDGALVRVRWSEIEPENGVFDFSAIERQRAPVKAAGKNWSLAVIAGWNTPDWLMQTTNSRMSIKFRGKNKDIIPFWNHRYQEYSQKLAHALAKQYGGDKNLILVYVPQQSANGIEGHFNGMSYEDLNAQGLTRKKWVDAAKFAISAYARAFPRKAIAIELHEIGRDTSIPADIINYIKDNHAHQVGIGVWWLSGKLTYQNALLKLIAKSHLPVYAQVIGNSSQQHRFPNGNYSAVFKQAKEIGANYIEVWNYELEKPVPIEITDAIKSFSSYSK